jgi:hypothetical protein
MMKQICKVQEALALSFSRLATRGLRSLAALLAAGFYAAGMSSAAAMLWNQTHDSSVEQASGGPPIPNSAGKPCTNGARSDLGRVVSNPNGGTVPATGFRTGEQQTKD